MSNCKTCGAPVNLAPDGDPRYESNEIKSLRASLAAEREKNAALAVRVGEFRTDLITCLHYISKGIESAQSNPWENNPAIKELLNSVRGIVATKDRTLTEREQDRIYQAIVRIEVNESMKMTDAERALRAVRNRIKDTLSLPDNAKEALRERDAGKLIQIADKINEDSWVDGQSAKIAQKHYVGYLRGEAARGKKATTRGK